jgi:uncharacterized membrane protein YGL010W
MQAIKAFLIDYCQRHAHPANAFFHIFGVPMAFYGFYKLLIAQWTIGAALVVVGYLLQYIGHKFQGNEVGEVTLAKNIYRRITSRRVAGENGR